MAFSGVTERGSVNEKVSDSSLAGSPSGNIAVGKILFAVLAFDNIATADGASTTNDTLTDTDGNVWTKVFEHTNDGGGAGLGVTGALWWTKVTTQIDTTDTITFNTDSATAAKVMGWFEVTVGAGQTIQVAGSDIAVDDGSNPAARSLSGLPSKEYLFLGLAINEAVQLTWTEAVGFTNVYAAEGIGTTGGGAGSNVALNVGHQILNGTGATFDVAGLTVTEHVIALLAFEEVAEAGTQSLTGSLFTKAPTFFTGAVTATYNLVGALFAKAPTFFTGTVTATRALTGTLFVKAPTFPTGAVSLAAGPQTLSGVLFTKAPTFPTGTVAATYSLTGTLFQKAPTFPQGVVTAGAVTLTGTLFTKAPTFPQGAITTGVVSLTGVLFQKAPTFPTGTVTAAINLTGSLFLKAPTFFTGTIGQAGTLFGTLFTKAPTFFTGTMGYLGGSFWRPNPVAYTLAPVGYTPIGPNDVPPWGIDIQGVVFVKAPTFPVGTVS